ncbi:transient receptor potential channel pyrexia-like [Neocloeon triangulifer]|uniref:transient receptor potential channel pyrexia-like n=1 Tax=Neocloeon triangulifer TaxID=2078957 RepID=UPI00286F0777|nr:transient receptor potential channel pyrexia-like [Neocloeon triangulifer]
MPSRDLGLSDENIRLQDYRRDDIHHDKPQIDFRMPRFLTPTRTSEVSPINKISIDLVDLEASLKALLESKGLLDRDDTLSKSNLAELLQSADECRIKALLVYAAYKGNADALGKILKKCVNDAAPTYVCNNLNALQIAIVCGHIKCIEVILQPTEGRRNWLLSQILGFSLLQFTIFHKNVLCLQTVIHFLQETVSPIELVQILNRPSEFTPHHTALHIAALQDLPEVARMLVDLGANVDAVLQKTNHTPLHVAALSKSVRTAEVLIEKGASLTAQSLDHSLTTLALVSSKIPRALEAMKPMLDSRIRLQEEGDTKKLVFDFTKLQKSPNEFKLSVLSCFVTCEQSKFLQHPLCQVLLDRNWERVRTWFFLRLILCIILLLSMTIYIVAFHTGRCSPPEPRFNASSISCPGNGTIFENVNSSPGLQILLDIAYCLVVPLTIIDIIRKLAGFFSFANSPSTPTILRTIIRYLKQFENYFEWFSLIATLYLFYSSPTPQSWHDRLAPLVVLIAWANFMILLGQLPWFGVYVEMYLSVLKEFVKLLMAYICLLIGYAISFYMIFKSKEPFSNPLKAIWKTLAMMIGELEYNDLFDNTTADMELLSSVAVQIVFIGFIFTIAIVLMNLLVGIVVHDVNEIKQSALATKLKRKVDLVEYLETTSGNIVYVISTAICIGRQVTCYDRLRKCYDRKRGVHVDAEGAADEGTFIVTYTQPKQQDFDSEALCDALKIAQENKELTSLGMDVTDNVDGTINYKRTSDNLHIRFRRNNAKIVQLTAELNQLVKDNNEIALKLKR